MTTSSPPPPEAACPLCERPNACAIAAGQDAASCWCMTACISAQVLQAIVPGSRGKRCICPKCAQVAQDCPGEV
ncbi:MAG: cysteine-rich CWC family protein [Burkholderiaceae bacterium]|nr:cysteine-rich CWC family protein [Burkholderiaceae bacterium]